MLPDSQTVFLLCCCCRRLNHSPLAYCPKTGPSSLNSMMEETFPRFSWNSWSHVLMNADWCDTLAAFISCLQTSLCPYNGVLYRQRPYMGKKNTEGKKSPRIDIMIYVFFSNIHVCTFFQERSCSGGAISEMWPWKDWDPSTSTAGWANGATLAVRSLYQRLPYYNLWKAGCQGREKTGFAIRATWVTVFQCFWD